MDCRKLLWLGAMGIGALVGCSHRETVPSADPYNTPPSQGARSPRNSNSWQPIAERSKKEPPEPKEPDGKPLSMVQIAEVQSQVALNEANSPEQRLNEFNLAKVNYRRAVQMDPKCLPAYMGMARLCSGTGDHEMAIHALDAGLAKMPREAALWHERGMVMGRLKQFDEALANLNSAARLEPENRRYAKDLGLMLARTGKAEDAVAWLRRSMNEADARYNVARMMQHIGQADEGQRQLQMALKTDPAHAASLAMLSGEVAPAPAESLRLAGHTEEAPAPAQLQSLRITIDPPSPDLLPQRPAVKPETPSARPAVQIGFEPNP